LYVALADAIAIIKDCDVEAVEVENYKYAVLITALGPRKMHCEIALMKWVL
jgi:hypothetical protein